MWSEMEMKDLVTIEFVPQRKRCSDLDAVLDVIISEATSQYQEVMQILDGMI